MRPDAALSERRAFHRDHSRTEAPMPSRRKALDAVIETKLTLRRTRRPILLIISFVSSGCGGAKTLMTLMRTRKESDMVRLNVQRFGTIRALVLAGLVAATPRGVFSVGEGFFPVRVLPVVPKPQLSIATGAGRGD